MPSLLDDDFSRGIVRSVEGQRIPKGGVYDCVNGLLDDDLGIYRRGGGAYKSDSAIGAAITEIWDGHLAAGPRTWFAGNSLTYILDPSDDESPLNISGTGASGAGRPVEVDGVLFFVTDPPSGTGVGAYAGSLKTGTFSYSTGTVTVTDGSKTVTGAGTAWSANADKGILFNTAGRYAVVESVDSDTQLTLRDPWRGSTAAGAAYELAAQFGPSILTTIIPNDTPQYLGSAGGRLLVGALNRVWFSETSEPLYFPLRDENFHGLAEGTRVVGIEGLGDVALVFTTGGVWRLTNMAYDLTDAYGNPQQALEQISKDVILWDEQGLAGFRGAVLVPAIDDVYLFGADGSAQPVSENIRPLYRSYVKAGYTPGLATVHRGHYFLPILNGSAWVDTLVCRLDGERPAWTRWDGDGASVAFAQRVGSTTRSPKLFSTRSTRVMDLTGAFSPASGNKSDADGTAHVLSIITRDYSVRAMVKAMWREVRARFELTDAASDNPTVTAEYATGPVAGESWTSVGSWAEGTGEAPTRLAVNKSAQSIRFRLRSSGACASLAVRSLEVFFRGSRKR
jgi:hypothetical protein